MCLWGMGRGVCVCGISSTERVQGEGPHSGVSWRQLEPALELCPERAELQSLSILSSWVGGDLLLHWVSVA